MRQPVLSIQIVLSILVMLGGLVIALPNAQAQTANRAPAPHRETDNAAPATPVDKEPPLPANPADRKVVLLARDLAAELNDQQVTALAGIRVNFGMMRAVATADKDVSQALHGCEDANPPLRPQLDDRFQKWHNALDPLLASQNKNLSLAVQAGVAGDPKKIQNYLDALDAAAADADSHLIKKPLTTPVACQALIKSMDRTHKTLFDALTQLQWPPLPAYSMPPAAPAKSLKKRTP